MEKHPPLLSRASKINIVQTVTFLLTNQVENIVYTLGHQGSFFLKIHSPPTKIKMISCMSGNYYFFADFRKCRELHNPCKFTKM